jgi:hypothetical protein
VTFGDSTNGGVARHGAYLLRIKRNEPHATAHRRESARSLDTCVPAPNHNGIENFCAHKPGLKTFFLLS